MANLVGPYDTNDAEAKSHGGPKHADAPVASRADGMFLTPYDSSEAEAKEHANGLNTDGKSGKRKGGSDPSSGNTVVHW